MLSCINSLSIIFIASNRFYYYNYRAVIFSASQDGDTHPASPGLTSTEHSQVVVVVVGIGHPRHRLDGDGLLMEQGLWRRENVDHLETGVLPQHHSLVGGLIIELCLYHLTTAVFRIRRLELIVIKRGVSFVASDRPTTIQAVIGQSDASRVSVGIQLHMVPSSTPV